MPRLYVVIPNHKCIVADEAGHFGENVGGGGIYEVVVIGGQVALYDIPHIYQDGIDPRGAHPVDERGHAGERGTPLFPVAVAIFEKGAVQIGRRGDHHFIMAVAGPFRSGEKTPCGVSGKCAEGNQSYGEQSAAPPSGSFAAVIFRR